MATVFRYAKLTRGIMTEYYLEVITMRKFFEDYVNYVRNRVTSTSSIGWEQS